MRQINKVRGLFHSHEAITELRKKVEQVFHRQDHHWDSYRGIMVGQAITVMRSAMNADDLVQPGLRPEDNLRWLTGWLNSAPEIRQRYADKAYNTFFKPLSSRAHERLRWEHKPFDFVQLLRFAHYIELEEIYATLLTIIEGEIGETIEEEAVCMTT